MAGNDDILNAIDNVLGTTTPKKTYTLPVKKEDTNIDWSKVDFSKLTPETPEKDVLDVNTGFGTVVSKKPKSQQQAQQLVDKKKKEQLDKDISELSSYLVQKPILNITPEATKQVTEDIIKQPTDVTKVAPTEMEQKMQRSDPLYQRIAKVGELQKKIQDQTTKRDVLEPFKQPISEIGQAFSEGDLSKLGQGSVNLLLSPFGVGGELLKGQGQGEDITQILAFPYTAGVDAIKTAMGTDKWSSDPEKDARYKDMVANIVFLALPKVLKGFGDVHGTDAITPELKGNYDAYVKTWFGDLNKKLKEAGTDENVQNIINGIDPYAGLKTAGEDIGNVIKGKTKYNPDETLVLQKVTKSQIETSYREPVPITIDTDGNVYAGGMFHGDYKKFPELGILGEEGKIKGTGWLVEGKYHSSDIVERTGITPKVSTEKLNAPIEEGTTPIDLGKAIDDVTKEKTESPVDVNKYPQAKKIINNIDYLNDKIEKDVAKLDTIKSKKAKDNLQKRINKNIEDRADYYNQLEDLSGTVERLRDKPPVEASNHMEGFFNLLRSVRDATATSTVGRKFGTDVVADIMYNLHRAEFELSRWERANGMSGVTNKSFNELQNWVEKTYDKQTMDDLMTVRGKPVLDEEIPLREEALNRLKAKGIGDDILYMIRDASDYNYDLARLGGIDVDYLQDYFRGQFKDPTKVNRALDYYKSTDAWTKHKQIPTYATAKVLGMGELRHMNPFTNIKSETLAIGRRLGMLDLRKQVESYDQTIGIKLDNASLQQKESWKPINDPVFKDMLFQPEYAKLVNNLIRANVISHNDILSGIRTVNQLGQQVKFAGSVFHMMNIMKGSMMSENGAFLNPKAWKDLSKALSNQDKWYVNHPYFDSYMHLGGGHGYSLEAQSLQQFSRALAKIPYIGKWLDWYPEWLFDNFIPRVKFIKFVGDANKLMKKTGKSFEELMSDGEGRASLLKNIIRTNNFHGEVNERLLGWSSTMTSGLRFIFQAPAYAIGNFKVLIEAMHGDVPSIRYIINTLLTTGMTATAMNMLLNDGEVPKVKNADDIRDLFKVKLPFKDDKGDDIYTDLMTYDRDFWMGIYPLIKVASGENISETTSESLKLLDQRFSGMTSIFMKTGLALGDLMAGRKLVDFKGDPIYNETDSLAEQFGKLLMYQLELDEPILFSSIRQTGASFKDIFQGKDIDKNLTQLATSFVGLRQSTSEDVRYLKKAKTQLFERESIMKHKISELANDVKKGKLPPEELRSKIDEFNAEQVDKVHEILGRIDADLSDAIIRKFFLIKNINIQPQDPQGEQLMQMFMQRKSKKKGITAW